MYSSDRTLEKEVFIEIRRLEESLWQAECRYDNVLMDKIFAVDFFEFGRSGRTYSRTEMMFEEGTFNEIAATLPLPEFHARYITDDVIQTTYISKVVYDGETLCGNRSSIWSRIDGAWQLRFHQGTPTE